jgi:AcrR family transcriptional regulator
MTFTEQARRRQIIDAAVLARAGYGAASLAAIAEEIGVSKGAIDAVGELLRRPGHGRPRVRL